jgi:DNA-binding XRE family transcriptional regulator
MPLNELNLAQNVRRLAGMHLASMDTLAQYCKVSRQTMQSIVAQDPARRSMPKAETAIKIAEAFAIPLNSLYQEPVECLRDAVDHFEEAPIAHVVEVPRTTIVDLIHSSIELEDQLAKARGKKQPPRGRRGPKGTK